MSEKFRLDRKIGFQNTFYTKRINVIIDSIGPLIILRSILGSPHANLTFLCVLTTAEHRTRNMPVIYNWASTQENLSLGFANNKSADHPAHPRRLIGAFVIRFSKVSYLNLLQAKVRSSS